jgi:transcriptional regulator GlxA family with amidase domain
VETQPIYVRDGAVYTSAGITAGIDLALALVEEDCGHPVAQEIARELVVFLQRPADQSQISAALAQQTADRDAIRELQQWLPDHLEAVGDVEHMADLVHMSPRTFARAFKLQTGATPAAYVETLRVEAGRRRLQDGHGSLDAVAAQVGFGSLKTMGRAFERVLGVSPAKYRASIPRR